MTDEKLDQILRQALAPEIQDAETTVHKRRKENMEKAGNTGAGILDSTGKGILGGTEKRIFGNPRKGISDNPNKGMMGNAGKGILDKARTGILGNAGKGIVAAAAAIMIGVGGVGYFHPALAAKIPLIGRIFEKVQDDVKYSGDYTGKGTVLTNEDPAGTLDTFKYSVSDSGITLTASEIYCDGYSIFLTVNIKAEEADFTHIPKHHTSMYATDSQTAAGFSINGSWGVGGNPSERLENTFDGEVVDSHTFAGMLKVDLTEKFEGRGELHFHVNGLGYDDDRMLAREDLSVSHWTDGNWDMNLPFEVDGNGVKTVAVGEKSGGMTLDDVVVSPYQVIVHTTTPGMQRGLTDDRRKKLLSKDPDLTDAKMLEMLGQSYEPCQTSVFNQDGELLFADMEMSGRASFAVQGKEIKALHIFIFDNLDDWNRMEDEGMDSKAANKAIIAKEIQVE